MGGKLFSLAKLMEVPTEGIEFTLSLRPEKGAVTTFPAVSHPATYMCSIIALKTRKLDGFGCAAGNHLQQPRRS